MIQAKTLLKICECFPNSTIALPQFDNSYLFDKKGATIGMIDWTLEVFYLHTNYAYYESAKKALYDNAVPFKEKEIDVVELIYGHPKP